MNIQNLVLDINKKPFQTITANVGEVASRFVRINIVDKSIPMDLTGVTASLYAEKPDGNKVFNNVTIEDKTNGIILAELTSQILAVEGLVKLTLLLVKNGGKLCSKQFLLNIDSSIVDDEAIESTNEFTALVDALGRVNNIDSRFEEVDSQLEHKANKSHIWSMVNMGQDVKEAMTGGSVAVVGKNAILSENIVNQQVVPQKLNGFTQCKNLINPKLLKRGFYYEGQTGIIKEGPSEGGFNLITEYIPVSAGSSYYANSYANYICFDSNLNRIANGIVSLELFTIPEGTEYIGMSFLNTAKEDDLFLYEATSKSGHYYKDYEFIMQGLSTDEYNVHNCLVMNGNVPVNYDTTTKQLDISTLIIIYKGEYYRIPDNTIIDLSSNDAVGLEIYSTITIYIDWATKEFKPITNDGLARGNTRGLLPVLAMRLRSTDTDFVPTVKYSINGVVQNDKTVIQTDTLNASFDNGPYSTRIDTVFLRNGTEQVYHVEATDSTSVRLYTGALQIYYRLINNEYSDITITDEFKDFILNHNECFVFDTTNRILKITTFGGTNRVEKGDIILLLNISGKLNGRLLHSLVYDTSKLSTKTTIMSGKELEFSFKCQFSDSYLSDFCFVDNELWCFAVSNDAHTNTADVARYSIDYENKNATKVGSFTHNFGHANTVDYCSQTDCLIMGNGGGSGNTEPNEFYVFPNAKDFKNQGNIVLDEKAIKYDVSTLDWGKQVNVFWGESNRGKYNIAYAISNNGSNKRFIRKLLLGQGTNKLENGTFIEGKTGLEFNGTFKVLDTWTRDYVYLEFNNGTDWHDGIIYEAYGDGALWWGEHELLDNGSIHTTNMRDLVYDDTGEVLNVEPEGITIKNGHFHLGDVNSNIYIYKL